jgi:hypothetical protein
MKKKITLQEAYELIGNASAVIIDDNALMYPSLWELTGEADNEWLYLGWDDEDGNEYAIKFIEEEQGICFDGSIITMNDSEGDEVDIKLLIPMDLKTY